MKTHILKNLALPIFMLSSNLHAEEQIIDLMKGSEFISRATIPSTVKHEDEAIKYKEKIFPEYLAAIKKSIRFGIRLEKNQPLKIKWNRFHAAFSKFEQFKDHHYKNPKFYTTFAQAMVETHDFNKLYSEVSVYLKKENKEEFNSILDGTFIYGIGDLLRYSWQEQDSVNDVTDGLVEAEMSWMLSHMRQIYYSSEQDPFWGAIGDTFMRGLICKPDEVIKVLTNKEILEMLPLEVVAYLPKVAKMSMELKIFERVGTFETGKELKNSPEIEKRRKIAKEKYLPQINKIIADYLKDKKADK